VTIGAALQGTPPAPPVPPAPGQEVSVTGSLEGWDAVLLLLGVLTVVALLLWPLIRAWARRIEAGASVAEAQAELDDLRARVAVLENQQDRLGEIENRLDFAERLLGRQEPERLKS
jgi:hypothetical protein